MAIFPRDVYIALKSELESSSDLSYVDVVVIRKYNRENLPDFSHHCIIINPLSVKAVPYPASQRWIENEIELILLGKKHYTSEDIIIADAPGESPPNVGVLAMYEDIFNTLYENNLGGEIELLPGLIELDNPTRFDILIDEESEQFIFEARLKYMPRGKRFVDLK